ncbi:MAG TPA: carboxypeptidase M32 [Longimicrobiaceae bacterium]|nr:carboxypeptidase M32 [Longimicrobiaceae bacterium]
MSEPEVSSYEKLMRELRDASVLSSAGAVLGWDQETMLPPKGTALRADQLAAIGGLVHERFTRPEVGEWLSECEADRALTSDPRTAANLREIRRGYDRAVKLPGSLVREIAQTTALSQQAWRQAREKSDFAAFAPWLSKMFSLSRAKAECYATDVGGSLYDALLDTYEPRASAAELDAVFSELRRKLTPLIAEIAAAGERPRPPVQRAPVPVERQRAFNRRVLGQMGFDFDAGRLDLSAHPFCEGIGPGDTRLTTRFREDDFLDALTSSMHEGGHGLYEQGLPKAEYPGQPLGEAASLGIHESQSRLWENFVGRSHAFWEWALPEARRGLGEALEGVSVEDVYRASNTVRPNLIRVDSDEATYNLHIMLRFDLERALLSGELKPEDLPGVWNERVRQDLGIDVPDDRRGCLQDIHWSMGLVGYFPTYTLGNLFAAQFWKAARAATPDLDDRMRRGDFSALLAWLRENIHRYGQEYTPMELCERATGSRLSAGPFIEYLEGKLRSVYGL